MRQSIQFIRSLWETLDLPLQSLTIIGIACLFQTSVTIFTDHHPTSPSDVAIRSVMSSIFGFIFGAQTVKNTNLINKQMQTIIASFVAFVCLSISIVTHWIPVEQDAAPAVEIRNLMFSAVGFLLSRAKTNE